MRLRGVIGILLLSKDGRETCNHFFAGEEARKHSVQVFLRARCWFLQLAIPSLATDVEVGPSDAELLQSARPWLSQLRRLAPDADASSLEDEKAELLGPMLWLVRPR